MLSCLREHDPIPDHPEVSAIPRTLVLCSVLLVLSVPAFAQTISFSAADVDVGSGLQSPAISVILDQSQHGGVFVTVASADSLMALVAPDVATAGGDSLEIYFPNGTTAKSIVVQALEGLTGAVDVTASAPGWTTDTLAVSVVTPGLRLEGVPTSMATVDPDDPVTARTGIPRADLLNLQVLQSARAGGPGITVTFTSSDAAVMEMVTDTGSGLSVQASVAPGANTTPTLVATGGAAVSPVDAGSAGVSISAPGFAVVAPDPAMVTVEPAALELYALPVDVGAGLISNQHQVRLNGTDHGGVTVHLESLDPSRLLLSAHADSVGQASLDVTIPDGQLTHGYYLHGLEGVSGAAVVSATASGWTSAVEAAEVVTGVFDISGLLTAVDTLDPDDAFQVRVGLPNAGGTALGALQDLRPGGPGATVSVISTDPSVGLLVSQTAAGDTLTYAMPAGSYATPSNVASGGFAFDGVGEGTVTVYAEIPGFAPVAAGIRTVTVTQPSVTTYYWKDTVGSGLQTSWMEFRLGASAHGGRTVFIQASDSTLVLLTADPDSVGAGSLAIDVPDGQTAARFYAQGLEGVVGTATVTAVVDGFSGAAADIDVVQPRVEIYTPSLVGSLDTIDPPAVFRTRIGIPNSSTVTTQELRAGSAGATLTFSVDDPVVATLLTAADTSDVVTAVIAAGESYTPSTLAAGGVAIDGLTVGTATVSVSAPGFESGLNAVRSVSITQPTMSLGYSGLTIGAGLQSSTTNVTFSALGHGGTWVHVASQDSTVLLVAPSRDVEGSGSLDLFVPDGESRAYFTAQALDGTAGAVTVDITADGFVPTSTTYTVVQPALDIVYLNENQSVGGADDPFIVRVGLPSGTGGSVSTQQYRRGGVAPLAVSLTVDTPVVADLVTVAATGPAVQVAIHPDHSSTGNTVLSGGAALRPLGQGSTLVEASIPGFFQTGWAQRLVTVSGDGIALLQVPATVGAGLQTGELTAKLSDGAHGGVTVTVASADTTRLLIAPDVTTPGSPSIDVFLPNGFTEAPFVIQALEGVTGTVSVDATASGFAAGGVSVRVDPAALQVAMLPDTLDVFADDVPFTVQTGVADASGDSLAVTQAVRAGAAPVVASLVLSDGGIADLRTQAGLADSVAVDVVAGNFQSAGTVAGGGAAFAPALPGTTTVAASAAGFTSTAAASHVLIVTGDLTGVSPLVPSVPTLSAASPNPFNPATTISFTTPREGRVRLVVHDLAGRRVRTLVDDALPAGVHAVIWRGDDDHGRRAASGVYLYRLETDGGVLSRKMVLMK